MKKIFIYLLLLCSLGTYAQTVGIKVATPIIKNNPIDNTVTGYANLLNGGFHIVPNYHGRDSLVTDYSTVLEPGMLVYEIAVDSTYRWNGTSWDEVNSVNIYNSDGALTSNRTVSLSSYSLNFNGNSGGLNVGMGQNNSTGELNIAPDYFNLYAGTADASTEFSLMVADSTDWIVQQHHAGKDKSIEVSENNGVKYGIPIKDDQDKVGLIATSKPNYTGTGTSIFQYTTRAYVDSVASSGSGGVPTSRTLTINGTAFDLTANRSWSVGTITSISGTTNRITSTGGTTPIIDISASYVGQSSITTVGTLTNLTVTNAPTFSAMTNHSVLFAGASGLLSQDNNNFYYDASTHILSVATNGDFSGTNAINIYGQYDAYEPQSSIGTVTSGTTFPGVTASTSRGTGASPLVNATGDYTGGFSGWGYTQSSPAYTYMAGMAIKMVGGTSSLGGQLEFYTKADGSTTTTLWQTIANDGTITFSKYGTGVLLSNSSGVVSSGNVSLTSNVSGILPSANGGTGVNNGSNTLTLAGNVTFTGAFNPTFSIPATATYTFPGASQTLASLAGTEALTNKTINNVTITAPATSSTLTIANGATLQQTGAFTLNLTTTATSTPTFPTGSGTLVYTSSAVTWTGQHTFSRSGIAATSSDDISETNTTAATSGTPVQFSPRIRQSGTGWTGSASQIADWIVENQPINGTSPITSKLVWSSQINAGGYTGRMSLDNSGNLTLLTGTVILKGYTVSTLPTGIQGMTAYVTDALTPSFGTTLVGGGSVVTKAFYNGTNWIAE